MEPVQTITSNQAIFLSAIFAAFIFSLLVAFYMAAKIIILIMHKPSKKEYHEIKGLPIERNKI